MQAGQQRANTLDLVWPLNYGTLRIISWALQAWKRAVVTREYSRGRCDAIRARQQVASSHGRKALYPASTLGIVQHADTFLLCKARTSYVYTAIPLLTVSAGIGRIAQDEIYKKR